MGVWVCGGGGGGGGGGFNISEKISLITAVFQLLVTSCLSQLEIIWPGFSEIVISLYKIRFSCSCRWEEEGGEVRLYEFTLQTVHCEGVESHYN